MEKISARRDEMTEARLILSVRHGHNPALERESKFRDIILPEVPSEHLNPPRWSGRSPGNLRLPARLPVREVRIYDPETVIEQESTQEAEKGCRFCESDKLRTSACC